MEFSLIFWDKKKKKLNVPYRHILKASERKMISPVQLRHKNGSFTKRLLLKDGAAQTIFIVKRIDVLKEGGEWLCKSKLQ